MMKKQEELKKQQEEDKQKLKDLISTRVHTDLTKEKRKEMKKEKKEKKKEKKEKKESDGNSSSSSDHSDDSDGSRKSKKKEPEWELIGSLKVDNGRWVPEGCMKAPTEVKCRFDVAYGHPRICGNGGVWSFEIERDDKHKDEDHKFMMKTSYFCGWGTGDGCCLVDMAWNRNDIC